MALSFLFLLSLSYGAVLAQYAGYGTDSPTTPSAPTPSISSAPSVPSATSSPSVPSATSAPVSGLTGDSKCSSALCVTAVVNDGSVQYTLQSTGANTLGWMAMGFGTAMANSAMVIMWPNPDGSITLSQRHTNAEVMPTVDSNPPRVATLLTDLSDTSGTKPQFSYSIPVNSDTKQNIVWAFGTRPPSSSAPDATLQQHAVFGTMTLDLTKTLASDSGSSNSSSPSSPSRSPGGGTVLAPYQKLIIAHAVFCVVGFLLILPAGALLARYLRTFSHSWFQGHQMLQFAVGGLIIVVGVSLGIGAVASAKAPHVNDTHKRWGIVLFVLYVMQCILGTVIHSVKPKNFIGRPPQNYMHAVLGLIIIGLAFYQVRTGYRTEWPNTTGLDDLPKAVDYVWYTWIVLLPLLYFGGLAFLPRQYAQERKSRQQKANDARWGEFGMKRR